MSDTLTVDVATTGADGTTHDDKTGLCPEGHGIMVRAKIDVEDPFYLEKCTHCGGIWFDSGEWQQIAQHQLIESLAGAHPEIASFGPRRRSRIFKILDIDRYACGFKNARALPGTKTYYFRMDTRLLFVKFAAR